MTLQSKKSNLLASHSDGLKSRKETLVGPKGKEAYHVDEKKLHDLIELHQQGRCYFDGLRQAYELLNLGPVNLKILQKLQDNDVQEFKDQFFGNVEYELKKTGIMNETILNNMRIGTDAPWKKFENGVSINLSHIERIRKMWPGIELSLWNYSIENRQVVFTDQDKEKLRETKATTYLDTPAKESFAMLAETTLRDLEKLNTRCHENGIRLHGYGNLFHIEDIPGGGGAQHIAYNKNLLNHVQI